MLFIEGQKEYEDILSEESNSLAILEIQKERLSFYKAEVLSLERELKELGLYRTTNAVGIVQQNTTTLIETLYKRKFELEKIIGEIEKHLKMNNCYGYR